MTDSPAPSEKSRDLSALSFWLLVGMIALIGVGKSVINNTLDPDVFWHLRVADQLDREGIHPLVDQLSYMSMRTPWTPYSWLAEFFMRGVWQHHGYRGAIVGEALLVAGFIFLIAATCIAYTGGGRRLNCVLATAFGAYLSIPYLSFRPITMALVLLALVTWLLIRDRRCGRTTSTSTTTTSDPIAPRGSVGLHEQESDLPIEQNPTLPRGAIGACSLCKLAVWLIVPITALLANIHLCAIVVPIWVACLLVGAVREKKHVRKYAMLLVLVLLASCATPMLAGAIKAAWRYESSDVMVSSNIIAEMRPIYYGWLGKITIALCAALLVAAVIRRERLRDGDWLMLIAGALLMLRLGRFAPIFALIAAPVAAATVPALSDRLLRRPIIAVVLAIALALNVVRIAMAFPGSDVSMEKWVNRRGPELPSFPTGAADYVDKNIPPRTGRLINEFNSGGYLAWRLGDKFKVFVDGRTQCYTPRFWAATYLGDEPNASVFERQTADVAILPRLKSRFHDTLIDMGWRSVWHDDFAEVLLPPPPTTTTTTTTAPTE